MKTLEKLPRIHQKTRPSITEHLVNNRIVNDYVVITRD